MQEQGLVRREKLRFHIVEDDGVIRIQILGCERKAAAQFDFVPGVQADQHRLVVALRLFPRLITKTAVERIAGFANAAAKVKLGLAGLDADGR